MDRLKTESVEKPPEMAKKKVLFHRDIAPVHSNRVAQQKSTELCFKLFPHLAYSPDLPTLDFYLFWKLKTFLAVHKFVCYGKAI